MKDGQSGNRALAVLRPLRFLLPAFAVVFAVEYLVVFVLSTVEGEFDPLHALLDGLLLCLVLVPIFYFLLYRPLAKFERRSIRAQQELRLSRQRLELALEGSNEGLWDWNVATGDVYFSPRWMEMLGYAPEELPPDVTSWERLVHPEDMPWVRSELQAHLRGETAGYETEHRVLRKDGSWAWILDKGKVVEREDDGAPLRMIGTHTDVTEQNRIRRDLDNLFNLTSDLVCIATLDGRLRRINSAWTTLLGYDEDELIGRNYMEFVHPDDKETTSAEVRRLARGGSVYQFENRYLARDGQVRWLSWVSTPVTEENAVYAIARDVTEKRLYEEALVESEEVLRQFVEHTPAAVAMFDTDVRYLQASNRWLKDYGLGDTEIIGRSHYEIFPEIPERWKIIHARCLQGEVERSRQDVFERADGSVDYLRWEVRPWRKVDGSVGGIIMFTEVVTEQVEARRALKLSEERFRTIAENSGDWFWETDRQGFYSFVSANVREVLKVEAEDMIGRHFSDSFHPDDRQELVEEARDIVSRRERFWDFRNRNLAADGSEVILETRGVPIIDEEGEFSGYRGVDRDVTQGVRFQQALARSNQLLESLSRAQSRFIANVDLAELFEGLLDSLLTLTQSEYGFIGEVFHDAGGAPYLKTRALTNIAWNEETRRFYEEHAPDGLEFRNLNTLFGVALTTGKPVIANDPNADPRAGGRPEGHPPLNAFAGVPFYSGTAMVGMIGLANRPEGYDDDLVAFLGPYLTTLGNIVHALRNDRKREKAEAALRDSERRLRSILEAAADGVITINEKGLIDSINPAAQKMFGWSEKEIKGRSIELLMPERYRELHERVFTRRVSDLSSYTGIIGATREVEGLRSDGSEFPMDLSLSQVRLEDKTIFAGIVRDITARKKMQRMQKEFISTVNHELRTPLTSIRGAIGLLQGGVAGELPGEMQRLVEIAYSNTGRLISLINDILDVEKIQEGKMEFHLERVDLAGVAAKAVADNAVYAEKYGTAFEMEPVEGPLFVMGDERRLAQVFANLLSNAAKYSPGTKPVTVRVTRHADMVRAEVEDRGPGIPEEFQPRVFDKFAMADSSDTRNKMGTGLGLAIAKAIVERHGGGIGFRTVPGEGTVFYFQLPAKPGQGE